MKIYIENLDGTINDDRLREIFASYGEVKSAHIVKDLFTKIIRQAHFGLNINVLQALFYKLGPAARLFLFAFHRAANILDKITLKFKEVS